MDDPAGRPVRLADDTAQACMGMNPAMARPGNGKVKLARTSGQQHHIALNERGLDRHHPAGVRLWKPAAQLAEPQGIASWQFHRPAKRGHCGRKQADAIKPGARIAAVEAKADADQRRSRVSQGCAAHPAGEG